MAFSAAAMLVCSPVFWGLLSLPQAECSVLRIRKDCFFYLHQEFDEVPVVAAFVNWLE
jgi:hypothetical protein